MKTITLTETEWKKLVKAGFPRQSLVKWTRTGVEPRVGTRITVKRLIGRDPWSNHDAGEEPAA